MAEIPARPVRLWTRRTAHVGVLVRIWPCCSMEEDHELVVDTVLGRDDPEAKKLRPWPSSTDRHGRNCALGSWALPLTGAL